MHPEIHPAGAFRHCSRGKPGGATRRWRPGKRSLFSSRRKVALPGADPGRGLRRDGVPYRDTLTVAGCRRRLYAIEIKKNRLSVEWQGRRVKGSPMSTRGSVRCWPTSPCHERRLGFCCPHYLRAGRHRGGLVPCGSFSILKTWTLALDKVDHRSFRSTGSGNLFSG